MFVLVDRQLLYIRHQYTVTDIQNELDCALSCEES